MINKFHLVGINRLCFLNDKETVPQVMDKVKMRSRGLGEGGVLKVREWYSRGRHESRRRHVLRKWKTKEMKLSIRGALFKYLTSWHSDCGCALVKLI